jgi:HAD superfamily hydrolase (TIGR01509 family)
MLPVGVLFDFDGVLVDSMPAHVEAWSSATRTIFGHGLDARERSAIVGKSTRVIASQIATWRNDPSQAAQLTVQKAEFLMSYVTKVEVFPGVVEMFTYLVERGIPFGIASNAPGDYVRATAAAMQFPVSVVLGCEDVAQPKPAPDLYLLCAKRLGLSPADHRRVFVFEDSTHGIEAALKAGATAIGITSHQPARALLNAGASKAYPSFLDFLAVGF